MLIIGHGEFGALTGINKTSKEKLFEFHFTEYEKLYEFYRAFPIEKTTITSGF
jgi:hypothetical protein